MDGDYVLSKLALCSDNQRSPLRDSNPGPRPSHGGQGSTPVLAVLPAALSPPAAALKCRRRTAMWLASWKCGVEGSAAVLRQGNPRDDLLLVEARVLARVVVRRDRGRVGRAAADSTPEVVADERARRADAARVERRELRIPRVLRQADVVPIGVEIRRVELDRRVDAVVRRAPVRQRMRVEARRRSPRVRVPVAGQGSRGRRTRRRQCRSARRRGSAAAPPSGPRCR